MATTIDRRGFDDVMAGYDFFMEQAETGEPLYYSIWNGQRLKFFSKTEDENQAREQFAAMLRIWEDNGTRGAMEIRFHEKRPNSALNNKSDYCGSFCFVLIEENNYRVNNPGTVAGVARTAEPVSAIEQMIRDISSLERLKQLLGVAPGAIGADAVPAEKTRFDYVEQILSIPVVEDLIIGCAKKFLNLDVKQAGEQSGQIIAGDMETTLSGGVTMYNEDTERLQAVLARLAVGEADLLGMLEKLADLKENNPKMYSMAKSML